MKRPLPHFDIFELLEIFENAIRCNHYCPTKCLHETFGYNLDEIKYEIVSRINAEDELMKILSNKIMYEVD